MGFPALSPSMCKNIGGAWRLVPLREQLLLVPVSRDSLGPSTDTTCQSGSRKEKGVKGVCVSGERAAKRMYHTCATGENFRDKAPARI